MPVESVLSRECERCGEDFEARPGRGRPRRFCVACRPRKRELSPVQLTLAVTVCLRAECTETSKIVRGLCRKHYAEWWHDQNPNYGRDRQARHPDYMRDYLRSWRAQNPERQKAISRRAYAKNRAANIARSVARNRGLRGASRETLEYRAILAGDPCVYCGAATTDIDHIDAVAVDGSNEWPNLTAACRRCNAQKSAKRLLEFLCLKVAA